MKSWNVLLNTLLLSLIFSFSSVQAKETDHPVLNINNASIEQLEQIKGIGAKKAQAIIEYRLQHGNFATIEDLSNVKGIGSKFIAKNKAWMSVQ
jgi:competence protein ComEA